MARSQDMACRVTRPARAATSIRSSCTGREAAAGSPVGAGSIPRRPILFWPCLSRREDPSLPVPHAHLFVVSSRRCFPRMSRLLFTIEPNLNQRSIPHAASGNATSVPCGCAHAQPQRWPRSCAPTLRPYSAHRHRPAVQCFLLVRETGRRARPPPLQSALRAPRHRPARRLFRKCRGDPSRRNRPLSARCEM